MIVGLNAEQIYPDEQKDNMTFVSFKSENHQK
jgi:hypothetical protein